MSEQQPPKKLRLASAAEALVEAASLEADAMTQKQLAQNLDSLNASFDGNLNRVVQTMKSSNENFDAKINSLNQHVTGVKNEISALKSLLEEETKQKTLERALGLTGVDSFTYYTKHPHGYGYGYEEKESEERAKLAIRYFMLGYGLIITTETLHASEEETGKEAFRKKFKEQIKKLIKREPRMNHQDDGNFTIYYS